MTPREVDRRFYEYLFYGLSEEQTEQVKAEARRLHALGYSWETAGLEAISPGLLYMAKQGIPLIGTYPSGAMIAEQKPENFTADPAEIAALMDGMGDRYGRARGTRIQRFYFIPRDAGLLCLDIDRKPGKRDGLRELYKLFPPNTLPEALQDIEHYFPCYVSTPSGGYHLYFKYAGELIRKTDICPEVEIKHGRPGLTAPGSCKENGAYILHGDILRAPPLYGIILDRILEKQNQSKEKRTIPVTSKNAGAPCRCWTPKERVALDTLADESVAKYSGHHDRQVSFAWRARRCRFSAADTLAYVTANPGVFGNGSDTENTIRSIFKNNGGSI